jgi:hypothetical protein
LATACAPEWTDFGEQELFTKATPRTLKSNHGAAARTSRKPKVENKIKIKIKMKIESTDG